MTLSHSKTKELPKSSIIMLLIVGFLVTLMFKKFSVLKPLSFYVTSVHEVCHGLAALLTGGKVHEINLHGNGGTAFTSGGIYPIISMAGYVGTALVGAMLLFLSQKEKWIDIFLILFSIIMMVLNTIYIQSYVNMYYISSMLLSIAILFSVRLSFTRHIGVFLSALFIFDSFTDAKIYLFYRFIGNSKVTQEIIYKTDAGILARYFGNEQLTIFIGMSFFLINISIYALTFYVIFKRKSV